MESSALSFALVWTKWGLLPHLLQQELGFKSISTNPNHQLRGSRFTGHIFLFSGSKGANKSIHGRLLIMLPTVLITYLSFGESRCLKKSQACFASLKNECGFVHGEHNECPQNDWNLLSLPGVSVHDQPLFWVMTNHF